jgi:hypothetical protein
MKDVQIHYAEKNNMPDIKWREEKGKMICRGYGKGPKNVLVLTRHGTVVVPRGNIKFC